MASASFALSLDQNLTYVYLTSMSMIVFLYKDAVNIELYKREYQVTFLMIFLLAICLKILIQQRNETYFMNPISILCILRKSLLVKKFMSMSNRKTTSCGKVKLGYSMPFAKSLNQFLSVPEVRHAINNSYCSEGDTM